MTERIAKIERTTLAYEDPCTFKCVLHLDYGGSGQAVAFGMGWVARAMKACGVDEWSKVQGRTVLALFDSDGYHEPVRGIKPLPAEPGELFMFRELPDEWSRARPTALAELMDQGDDD